MAQLYLFNYHLGRTLLDNRVAFNQMSPDLADAQSHGAIHECKGCSSICVVVDALYFVRR
jgi:hypothetical protein